MANPTSPGPTIPALVAKNLDSLKSLVESGQDAQSSRDLLLSHLARFKLWAGSLGAHRQSGSRSLEFRLRDASRIRNHVVSLLQDLDRSTGEGEP